MGTNEEKRDVEVKSAETVQTVQNGKLEPKKGVAVLWIILGIVLAVILAIAVY